MRLTGWFVRVAGLVLLCLSLSCGNDLGPRVPANIVIVPNQPVVPQGLTLTLTATVVDAAGKAIRGKVVTFTSSDTLTATVSAIGVVTSVGPLGTARITATFSSLTAFVDVAVQQRIVGILTLPDTLRLNPPGLGFIVVQGIDANGDPASLPSGLSFASSDTTIAAVDAIGNVLTGSAQGTATITVTVDTFTVQVPVIVAQIPTTIQVSPRSVVLAPSATQQLTPTVLDLYGTPISGASFTYRGDSPSLFTVSGTGLVTSLGPTGSGIVTLTSGAVSTPVNVFVGSGAFGTIVERTAVPAAAYAAAVSPAGAVIVSLASSTHGVRGDLPSYALDTTAAIADPLGVAINPAGTLGYFALRSNGDVAVLNLATNQLQAPITGAVGEAFSVAVSADGQFVFVGATNRIYKFDAASGALVDSANFTFGVHLAVHPTQGFLYASGGSGVAEIDMGTMAVTRTFAGASQAQAVAVAPDGSELYVADESALQVRAFNLTTGLAAAPFTTSHGTFGLAVTANLLVATESVDGEVQGFDRVSRTPTFALTTTGVPRRPAFNAAGNVIVVPNEGGWVDFIR